MPIKHLVISGGGPTMFQSIGAIQYLEQNGFVNLNNITSITSDASNSNLTLKANGTGSIAVDNILTFNSSATTPTAGSITKIYNKTVGSGGTGVFFVNSTVDSGAEGELISKKKARAYAIALG